MEKGTLFVIALVAALVVGGGVFFWMGREAGLLPDQLSAALTGSNPSPSPEVQETVVAEAPDAMPNDEVPAEAPLPEAAPKNDDSEGLMAAASPLPVISPDSASIGQVAGAQEVAPSAETGAMSNLILAAFMAVVVGLGGLMLAV